MTEPDEAPIDHYGSPALALLRWTGFILLLFGMMPVHILAMVVTPRDFYRIPRLFHRILLKIIGFDVRVHGAICTEHPVFFVANHTSYLDIPVLGALIPASFVAKAEVAGWPLFGFMAKLQHTVFIERRQARALQQRDQLQSHLAKGRSLILFPEGTSSSGQRVLPFKSSLFSTVEAAAEDIDVAVQPVSLTCTAVDGLPMTQNLRSFYAWYGDMTLLPHLWQAFKCDRFTIDVVFHPVVRARRCANRKEMASLCQAAVASGVEQAVTGRWLTNDAEPARLEG